MISMRLGLRRLMEVGSLQQFEMIEPIRSELYRDTRFSKFWSLVWVVVPGMLFNNIAPKLKSMLGYFFADIKVFFVRDGFKGWRGTMIAFKAQSMRSKVLMYQFFESLIV
jgi:hypothetical protein